MRRGTLGWALAAICGLLVAGAITWSTSQIASQRIGLSSEPLSINRPLATPAPGGGENAGRDD